MATEPSEAVTFMQQAADAESDNRLLGLTALQFSYGDQWPQYAINSRGLERPQLTINETNTYIKKVTNAQRKQRPRGKASPVDNFADKKIAKVITGLWRHIEVNSDADNAYDTAFDFAARIGWGYLRMRTDYIDEKSRNQDIFIDMVDNPFTVYFDPNSSLPDGSDANGALVTDMMSKKAFRLDYPGAQESNYNTDGTGDSMPDWVQEHDIRLAEYFKVDRTPAKLVYLSNGKNLYADELPPPGLLAQFKITVQGDRDSYKRVVKWRKQTGFEILEEKILPGRWIPVIPIYWTNTVVDGKRMRCGLVKDAMDPQRMLNFWQTMITEALALAPKAKWLISEGQDEGHENEFKNANLSSSPVLRFKPTDVDGKPAPPPQRIAPEPPPAGAIEASFMASQNLSRVLGIFDPAVRGGAQHKSDKTLNAEQGQSESTNFDGYDNLTRSMKHCMRIGLSWFPVVFDTQQVKRIIGDDGRDSLVTVNEKTTAPHPETGDPIEKVLNDITVGTYDVIMETGPGYETARKEGVAATLQLMETPIGEKVAQSADDLIVRGMDFPGADLIADRLAAANPLSQIDEQSEIPPQAQMKMKAQEQMIQQLQQQLQAAGVEIKFGLQKEGMKQEGETRRTLMQETAKTHDVELKDARAQHDTETKALSAQNVEEIKGLVALLLRKLDHKEAVNEFERDVEIQDKQLAAKSAEKETVQ